MKIKIQYNIDFLEKFLRNNMSRWQTANVTLVIQIGPSSILNPIRIQNFLNQASI